VVHPISVACILVELGMDSESIAAALLHDVVEDTDVTLEELRKQFGADVAYLIDGVTKLGKIEYSSHEEHQAENLRKMMISMATDIRVMIIKLADRINNMRTLWAMPGHKQRLKAHETMEIYAPLAHRLGIHAVKEELEDLSLRYLDRPAYQEISDLLGQQQSDRETFLIEIKRQIHGIIEEDIPDVKIEGRIKSVNGIYRKMYVQNKDFSNIYDIYAVRIIVNSVPECWEALGIINGEFTPLPNRYKDYITTPKLNGYKSLHNTYMWKGGDNIKSAVPFEVQIRTVEMHQQAEYGVAAHWKYKSRVDGSDSLDRQLAWIRDFIDNQENAEAAEVLSTIKYEIVPEEIYVYTPRADIKILPTGATALDFAYAIHSQVGHRMTGAKVNGKMVQFAHKLQTGDVVEIVTTKEITVGPRRDWLKIAVTGMAKGKIRSWLKNEKRAENIESGRSDLEREMKRANIRIPEEKYGEFMDELAKKSRFDSVDDFYAAIGYGGLSMERITARMREEYQRLQKSMQHIPPEEVIVKERKHGRGASEGVYVEGMDNCLVKMSKCCNPLPGDDIIGFITRGYGVSVHKRSCANVPADVGLADEPMRWVAAEWSDRIASREFKSTLRFELRSTRDLHAVTAQFYNMHLSCSEFNMRDDKEGRTWVIVTISVGDKDQLDSIIQRLQRVPGIISVERTGR
ncbi:MAG: bifunctional (p)ppGpp synthetase/guanosine-3',5'-bis(diphosphate) 3'-pyrophosphohydrolase, partial [Oscillospiraceae bacterium]|nr:bifunctional (p)ppGpp synthetase/guanosine-3',5'-bis(diphosphate) 3'-pyrophosphohydrolase [Oscillospiraceae bacterium]